LRSGGKIEPLKLKPWVPVPFRTWVKLLIQVLLGACHERSIVELCAVAKGSHDAARALEVRMSIPNN